MPGYGKLFNFGCPYRLTCQSHAFNKGGSAISPIKSQGGEIPILPVGGGGGVPISPDKGGGGGPISPDKGGGVDWQTSCLSEIEIQVRRFQIKI